MPCRSTRHDLFIGLTGSWGVTHLINESYSALVDMIHLLNESCSGWATFHLYDASMRHEPDTTRLAATATQEAYDPKKKGKRNEREKKQKKKKKRTITAQ